MASDILIIDDEADIRELVAGILEDEGYATRTARDSDEAAVAIAARRPAGALRYQGGASRSAGGDDFRPRQYRNGGGGDQAGRLRLHRETIQGRSARPRGGSGARSLATEARGQGPQAAGAASGDACRQLRRHATSASDH